MVALETAENPDRLKNRGGQLLKEETERKKIARDLPTIRQEILDFAAAYEQQKNKVFFVNGRNIVDAINSLYEEREERKQLMASNRKLNGTAIARTPISVNKSTLKRVASVTMLVKFLLLQFRAQIKISFYT